MTRGGARLYKRAQTRPRLLGLIAVALSLLGPVCCEAVGHQNKASEAVEHEIIGLLDPKRDCTAPPPVKHVEHIEHSSHGSDQASSAIKI